MLAATRPEAAERLAKIRAAEDSPKGLTQAMRTLRPLDGAETCNQYWALRMRGQRAEADAVLRKASADGVPLPDFAK
jgi:hypothetical protein